MKGGGAGVSHSNVRMFSGKTVAGKSNSSVVEPSNFVSSLAAPPVADAVERPEDFPEGTPFDSPLAAAAPAGG